MPKDESPYRIGNFWLDKRRDGKSPDIWQIATYDAGRRQVVYRSTHCRGLEDAKGAIRAHEEADRSIKPQTVEDAGIIPNLMAFWREHGKTRMRSGTVASSIRVFIGFLMQDQAGVTATISDINPAMITRFLNWRRKPHSFEVTWDGKAMPTNSPGVRGESVQRNIDDLRSALNYQSKNGRIPYAPKVPSVPQELRSPPRDRVLTIPELGRIVGIAAYNPAMFRRVCLVLATTIRTEAALKMDPARQYDRARHLLDLHPVGAPRTKKHNPVVPLIDEFESILIAWGEEGAKPISESKTAWRTLRRCADLGSEVELKTIRHTVATMMRGMGVPPAEISGMLGHAVMKGSSAVYAKYDPTYLVEAKKALSIIFRSVMAEAWSWSAVHILSKTGNGKTIVVDRDG